MRLGFTYGRFRIINIVFQSPTGSDSNPASGQYAELTHIALPDDIVKQKQKKLGILIEKFSKQTSGIDKLAKAARKIYRPVQLTRLPVDKSTLILNVAVKARSTFLCHPGQKL